MKIKCYIPSYSCPEYFYKVVNTFASYHHDVTFILYVASDVDPKRLPQNKCDIRKFDPSIGHGLVHQYYDDIKKDIDNYDIFIYSEDDIEILPETFDLFLKLNRELDDEHVVGFMRYEIYEGRYYMNEFQPGTPHSIAPQPQKINNKWYVSYQNVHQGCFILEKRNLKKLLSNPEFVSGWPNNKVMLEDAATNVYKSTWPGTPNGLQRVCPVNEVKNLIIHHLSDRHTKISRNYLELNQVEQEIQLCLTRLPHQ